MVVRLGTANMLDIAADAIRGANQLNVEAARTRAAGIESLGQGIGAGLRSLGENRRARETRDFQQGMAQQSMAMDALKTRYQMEAADREIAEKSRAREEAFLQYAEYLTPEQQAEHANKLSGYENASKASGARIAKIEEAMAQFGAPSTKAG